MTDIDDKNAPQTPKGDRIAKVIARAGIASRRDAEAMINEGRVKVNGAQISSAALNVTPDDMVTVDGRTLAPPDRARLWLYHKPAGLVTTTRDEQGRETVFDHLPSDLPRVMSVGRLDLNSEGLLLLTNDGDLKRRLELPSTGWLRRYRVRVRGTPKDTQLDPLRQGVTVDGERFAPMQVTFDRQQGANAWLTIGLREGKNREIRRAMESQGLLVNRLIRISYGPFQLGALQPEEVEEIRARVLRDQLGETTVVDDTENTGKPRPKTGRKAPPKGGKRFENSPRKQRDTGEAPNREKRGERPDFKRKPREDGDKPRRFNKDERPNRGPRREDGKPHRSDGKPRGERPDFKGKPREDGDRPRRFERDDRPRDFGNKPRRDRAAEKAEAEEKKRAFMADPSKSMRKDAKGAPKRGSARKGGRKSPGAGLYGSRDLGGKGPQKKP